MRKLGVGIILIAAAGCGGGNSASEEGTKVALVTETPVSVSTSTTVIQPEQPTTTVTVEPEPTTVPTTAPPETTRPRPVVTFPPRSSTLASIRACESGGDYTINTGNGYYGAYQFSLSTWQSVGGSGYPHLASPAEQDMRAQIMIDSGRRGEWPSC